MKRGWYVTEQNFAEDTGLDTVSQLSLRSGITRSEILEVWEKVKQNREKVGGCRRHRFEGDHLPVLGNKQCCECGGELSKTAIVNYIAGYRAAGGDPADIWPEFAQANGNFYEAPGELRTSRKA
jgi:hypothetical protein